MRIRGKSVEIQGRTCKASPLTGDANCTPCYAPTFPVVSSANLTSLCLSHSVPGLTSFRIMTASRESYGAD